MDGYVISPELALVDPAAAAAHRARLPAIVLDSAIATARAARRSRKPSRIEVAFGLPVWLAAATYVVVKVALTVLLAMLLVGSVALASTLVPA